MVIYSECFGSCYISFRAGAPGRDADVSDFRRAGYNIRCGVISNYRITTCYDWVREVLAAYLYYRPAWRIHCVYGTGVAAKYSLQNGADLEDAGAGPSSRIRRKQDSPAPF